MNMDLAGDDLKAHVVGLAISMPGLDSAAGHPSAEALWLMLATVRIDRCCTAQVLAPRRATEFARPQYERVFEHSSLFQILDQSGNRLVGLIAELGEVATNVAVMIPTIHCDLHKSNA